MIRTSMMIGRTAAWVACLVLGFGAAVQADTVVYSNAVGGDAFYVAPVPANRQGEAVGSTGWYYNSVGGAATIGISSSQSFSPRSGNGSVLFQGVDGNSKADIEYFKTAGQAGSGGVFFPTSALGQLKNLTSLSYDWYRDSSSTNPNVQSPALRLQLTDGASQNGYLVFEPTYNQLSPPVTVDKWVSENVVLNDSIMWTNGTLPNTFTYQTNLSQWMNPSSIGNLYVVGVSSGMGSGWNGSFLGAVDNIHFGFGTDPGTTYNFEVRPVPEPASVVSMLIAGGFGLAGAAYRRRRAR